MAKLTKEQWADIRRRWEADARDGHQWLADELVSQGVDVNRAAIAKAASRQGWAKRDSENVTPKNVTQNVTLSDKASLKNVPPVPIKNVVPEATTEPEWEEVDETHHGNSKYKQGYNQQAYRLCLLGATDKHLAEFFGVSESTINLWKLRYAEFSESLKVGKMMADANVAESLYHRSIGYSHPDTHVSVINHEVVLTELTKHYPPDTKAAFIWLKNRQPTLWRDKVEVEHSDKLNPEMMDRIKTEFVDRMAMARERQRQVLIDRGLIDD